MQIYSSDRPSGMSGERVERRLAAIFAADVAGYSRLMGKDEAGTLARLRTHRRELIDPKIAEHKGRIVKTTGDGMLVEFPASSRPSPARSRSSKGMAERNSGVPANERIEFRVGINLGNVIVEDGDIFGDGVNVAARLEGLAEPGGICISRRSPTRSATSCPTRSTIWANKASGTSRDRFGSTRCARKPSPTCRYPSDADRARRAAAAP